MTKDPRQKVLKALYVFLQPIARAMLRAGVSHAEFEEVAKAAFVNVAKDEFGVRGRKTNLSRVAVITGISRKETRRLSDWDPDSEVCLSAVANPLVEMLHIWHTNPEYIDERGKPLALSYEDGAPSFVNLVKALASDLPPGAIKTELLRSGSLEERDGLLRVVKREFVPESVDDRLVEGLISGMTRHAETVAHNSNPENLGAFRFERIAESVRVDPEKLSRFRKSSLKALIRYSEEYDDRLPEYDIDSDDKDSGVTAGVGFYYFESKPKKSRQ